MIFPKIPMMKVDEKQIGEPTHYGAGNVVTIVSDTSKEDYLNYLTELEAAGLTEYVVNEEGVGGTVFGAIYTMGKWVVTVTYAERTGKTYISTCFDLPLSKHLHYSDDYVAENKPGAKTKIDMLEMWNFGNSFVIQLKNGHFIVSDGGLKADAPYLVDYLESLTTEGEKPVVEAWIFTHGHGDHCGIMGQFFDDRTLCERIYVEGFYYNEPNDDTTQLAPGVRIVGSWMRGAAGVLKTTEGTRPKVYRPQTGQRYYFCDITMDIVHGQEQLLREDYSGDINDSSTWCMFTIEGQKCLFTGDGEKGCMKMMMEHYTKEYLNVDVMTLMHHGFNTQDSFTDYCKVKTLLVTTKRVTPVRKANENTYLKESVEEYFDWSDGTKVLTFPYTVGSFESLKPCDWKYNQGQVRTGQPNCYRYPSAHKNKEIRYFRPVKDNGFAKHSELLMRTIGERMPVRYIEDGMLIELCVDETIGPKESYQIRFDKFVGWVITGSDETGLFYGIGKFLHSATWTKTGFIAKETDGVISPACSFRAMYFAVHLFNWYANASTEELEKYVEELLLWGYNAIVLIIPVINIDNFEDDVLYFEAVEKSRSIFELAKKLGMQVGIIINPNQGLQTAPHEFDADPSFDLVGNIRGHAGRNLCPSKPGVVDYLRTVWVEILKQYQDMGLDYLVTWPYDEGGCGCDECKPWGAKAYCDLVLELRKETLKFYPNIKFIVSTWIFDKPEDQGEYEGLYKRLKGDLDWVDYIMVDAHADFPRYPLEHDVIKPIVNFPEISMWKLFPWGGYGANPLPKRFQEIWDSSKRILSGGMPYSEGMYEDILKVQYAGYYWEPDKHYRDILAEYIGYEYEPEVYDEVMELMELIEENHVLVGNYQEPKTYLAIRAGELARCVDAKMGERARTSWRWRILYIRAITDQKRYEYYRDHNMGGKEDLTDLRHYGADFLQYDDEAQELFKELRKLYSSVEFNGRNHYTLPFVGGGTVCNGMTYFELRGKEIEP